MAIIVHFLYKHYFYSLMIMTEISYKMINILNFKPY